LEEERIKMKIRSYYDPRKEKVITVNSESGAIYNPESFSPMFREYISEIISVNEKHMKNIAFFLGPERYPKGELEISLISESMEEIK
jgi:hypothetical protein